MLAAPLMKLKTAQFGIKILVSFIHPHNSLSTKKLVLHPSAAELHLFLIRLHLKEGLCRIPSLILVGNALVFDTLKLNTSVVFKPTMLLS